MSSEGSVTSSESRIRQFGLYRTIDARTEEFLRSSRKRQIRQGCACAAISTAITVTVVVSVILVYEYSINSEANLNKKNSLKPNWFGLMNESDIASLDSKFNKKINFDRTTLKLLPILLKALNKNRYLEKILEDYSSSSPPHLGKDSTEATYIKNVFSDSKNWLKMPSPKLYTLEPKTSPLIYWKSPTQRLDYLTKIRKIRDYQRMLNYFDKMINDKVGNYQKRELEYTERPLESVTTPMKKDKSKANQQNKLSIGSFKNSNEDNDKTTSCKCSKQLGNLLTKLVLGIQDVLPHFGTNKIGLKTSCQNENQFVQSTVESTTHPSIEQITQQIKVYPTTTHIRKLTTITKKTRTRRRKNNKNRNTTTDKNTTTNKISSTTSTTERTTTTSLPTTTSSTMPTTTSSTRRTLITENMFTETSSNPGDQFESKYFEDITIQMPTTAAYNLIPNDQTYEKNTLDYDAIVKPTDVPIIETTESSIMVPTTETFVPMKFVDLSNEVLSTEKSFLITIKPTINIPLIRDEEYDDYFATTSKNDFNKFDPHYLELITSKMMSTDSVLKPQKNVKKSKPLNYPPTSKPNDFDLGSMRKMAGLIYIPREIQKTKEVEEKISKTKNPDLIKSKLTTMPNSKMPTNAKIKNSVESNVSLSNSEFTGSLKNTIKISNLLPDLKNERGNPKFLFDQGNYSDLSVDDEYQDEFASKQELSRPITILYKYKNSTQTLKPSRPKKKETKPNPSSWEVLKNDEKITAKSIKSMLPAMRPIYLEVQRNNDWKQDDQDHPDYDINFNNNIFDLPNI